MNIGIWQQHNSHIYNNTNETVQFKLTDTNERSTVQMINPEEVICIPTPHGTNTLSIIDPVTLLNVCSYSNDSDRSFIIQKFNYKYRILRSKYRHVKTPDTGLQ